MLIKDTLLQFVKSIDMDTEGQIWVILNFLVSYKLGGVYIPTDDSPYYQASDMGSLASHTQESGNVIAIGDFNARVALPNLTSTDNIPYVYNGIVDNILNARGKAQLNTCSNKNMVIANHLKYNNRQLEGNLSFKRRGQ